MKRLLIAALVAFMALGSASFAGEGRVDVKFNRLYKAPVGGTQLPVYFDHGAHSLRMSKNCNYCHDVIKNYGGFVSPATITADKYWGGGAATKPIAHFICRDCHVEQNLTPPNNAPTTVCSGCHGNAKL